MIHQVPSAACLRQGSRRRLPPVDLAQPGWRSQARPPRGPDVSTFWKMGPPLAALIPQVSNDLLDDGVGAVRCLRGEHRQRAVGELRMVALDGRHRVSDQAWRLCAKLVGALARRPSAIICADTAAINAFRPVTPVSCVSRPPWRSRLSAGPSHRCRRLPGPLHGAAAVPPA